MFFWMNHSASWDNWPKMNQECEFRVKTVLKFTDWQKGLQSCWQLCITYGNVTWVWWKLTFHITLLHLLCDSNPLILRGTWTSRPNFMSVSLLHKHHSTNNKCQKSWLPGGHVQTGKDLLSRDNERLYKIVCQSFQMVLSFMSLTSSE